MARRSDPKEIYDLVEKVGYDKGESRRSSCAWPRSAQTTYHPTC
jgi:hypothetical protein